MQRRGGKGRIGMRTREEDFVSHLFVASTHAYIMIFSDRGRVYWLKVHEIPDVGPGGKGKAIANLVPMEEGEKIAALLAVKDSRSEEGQQFIVMGTRKGVDQEDRPVGVQQSARRRHHRDGRRRRRRGHRGRALRRQGADLPRHARRHGDPLRRDRRPADGPHAPTASAASRCATTTRSWRWRSSARAGTLLTVAQNGYGKRTELDEYRLQSRGGVGIINIQTSDRNGKVVGIAYVHDDDEVMMISQQGKILRMRAGDIRADRPRHAGRAADRDGRRATRSSRSRSWRRRKTRTATSQPPRRKAPTGGRAANDVAASLDAALQSGAKLAR